MVMMLVIIGLVLVLSLVLGTDRSWSNILVAERNDMVFEQRNRSYGAYYLRNSYTRLLMFALLGTMGFVGFAVGLPKVIAMFDGEEVSADLLKREVMVELQQVEEEKLEEEPPPPPPPPPPPQIEQLQFTPPVATNEEVEDPPTQEEVQNTNVGETTQEGEDIDAPPVEVVNEVVEDELLDMAAVQEQPDFPGGISKFYEYVAKNTKYPAMEKESNIQGKVWVEFEIGKDGSVTGVKVIRPLSPGLDAEAVRVIKSSPKWSPGKNNGKPVRVKYKLPIKFTLAS